MSDQEFQEHMEMGVMPKEITPNLSIEDVIPPVKIDPLDPAPLVKLFERYVDEIDKMDIKAADHQVTDDESNEIAVTMTGQAKKLTQIINKKHKELKAPYLLVTGKLDAFRKKLVDRLEQTQKIINSKIAPYLQLLDAKRKKEQREADEKARIEQERLDAEAKKEADRLAEIAREKAIAEGKKKAEVEKEAQEAAAMAEPAPVVVAEAIAETKTVTDAGTAKLKPVWDWEITDFKALPDQAFENRKEEVIKALSPWINAQVKIGIRNVPGVKIFQTTKMETRTKR